MNQKDINGLVHFVESTIIHSSIFTNENAKLAGKTLVNLLKENESMARKLDNEILKSEEYDFFIKQRNGIVEQLSQKLRLAERENEYRAEMINKRDWTIKQLQKRVRKLENM